MREPGSGTRLIAERFLDKHGIKPRIGMEIGSNETIKQAVIAGLGIAFISAHTIASEIEDGRLSRARRGRPARRCGSGSWCRPAAKRLMPAAGALRDFLVAEGRRFLPDVGQAPLRKPPKAVKKARKKKKVRAGGRKTAAR